MSAVIETLRAECQRELTARDEGRAPRLIALSTDELRVILALTDARQTDPEPPSDDGDGGG